MAALGAVVLGGWLAWTGTIPLPVPLPPTLPLPVPPPSTNIPIPRPPRLPEIRIPRPAPAITSPSGLPHSTRTTKKNSSVSIASVPVTAIPYALASFSLDPKPTTSAITAAKMIQFAAGTYTWPTWY